jgi:hypothetical protein
VLRWDKDVVDRQWVGYNVEMKYGVGNIMPEYLVHSKLLTQKTIEEKRIKIQVP